MTKEKIIYKNQKRKVRNRLIYLVGLHLGFIFILVGLMCFQYLIEREWYDTLTFSLISDAVYLVYSIGILVAIKFKYRKTLLLSIFTLSIAIGIKITVISMLQKASGQTMPILIAHLLILCLNIFIPISLLFYWNKLKTDKWRQTFDLETKLNNHLLKSESDAIRI